MPLNRAHNHSSRLVLHGSLTHIIQIRRTKVGRHDHDRIPEIDNSALSVRQPAVVEDLEEERDKFARSLLDLVDENDAVWLATNVFGELSSAVVTDVAGWGTNEAGDGVLLGVLAAIDTDHSVGRVEEKSGELEG